MPRKLFEITATYTFEKHRFANESGDVIIGDVVGDDGKRFSAKFTEEEDEPTKHLTYNWYGFWSSYTNKRTGEKQEQFHVKTFVRCQPHGRAGTVAYLAKSPHIGRVLAGRLWEKFKSDAVKVLRLEPEVAAVAIKGLSEAAALEASAWLDRQKNLEDCMISLVDLLDGRGFPKQAIKEAVRKWGNQAADIIKQNPYRLMALRGCGFKRADSLYLDLGHNPAALKRQALCAWYTLAERRTGDTWHYIDVVRKGLAATIGGAEVNADKAIRLAVRGGLISLTHTDGIDGTPNWDGSHCWAADARDSNAELRLAKFVSQASREGKQWPAISSELISQHQAEKLDLALQGPVGILSGGPGVGKTRVSAQVIKDCAKVFGYQHIGICGPTGKSAVRLTEVLNDYGIKSGAKTIHSLLGVKSAEDGWSFNHGEFNPLPFKLIVIDEFSMVDTSLAASLFAARATGTLVLILGDIGQLPPVGHGAPLRDMIAAGLPYGELKEIHRNEGGIVQACSDMQDGKEFSCTGNLVCREGDHIANMLEILRESQEDGLDPVWDCQVLCAVNKKSKLSRHELNQVLQAHLNPNPKVPGSPFRLDDKVVNTKNGWYPPVREPGEKVPVGEDGKVYVANGELGRVRRVEPKYMHVKLTSPDRLVIVPRGVAEEDEGEESLGTGCNWDLGFAISTHRSQGSEWPVILFMVDESPGAARICSRELIYTAISRAKKTCYLVGRESVAQQFAKKTVIDRRKTFLTHLISR